MFASGFAVWAPMGLLSSLGTTEWLGFFDLREKHASEETPHFHQRPKPFPAIVAGGSTSYLVVAFHVNLLVSHLAEPDKSRVWKLVLALVRSQLGSLLFPQKPADLLASPGPVQE